MTTEKYNRMRAKLLADISTEMLEKDQICHATGGTPGDDLEG